MFEYQSRVVVAAVFGTVKFLMAAVAAVVVRTPYDTEGQQHPILRTIAAMEINDASVACKRVEAGYFESETKKIKVFWISS